MKTIGELKEACGAILEHLKGKPEVSDAMVFVSSNTHILSRLNFTSHIPSNGVEEPKATQNFGLGLTVVFDDGRVGFGNAESGLSIEAADEALSKAQVAAVLDPDFKHLPRPEFGERTLFNYHDAALMEVSDDGFVSTSWDVLRAGLEEFTSRAASVFPNVAYSELGLIVGGDVQIVREKVAIASYSNPVAQVDESVMTVTSITAMIERENAKGTGFAAGNTLSALKEDGPAACRRAVQAAFETIAGERIETGTYTVVFGPEAVAQLVHNLMSLSVSDFYYGLSPFQGKFGQAVASPKLTIYDDGANPEFLGAKGITCEGLPTGKSPLITDGVLEGLLSDHYAYQQLLNDPDVEKKLGVDPMGHEQAFWPRSGYRFSTQAGRHASGEPHTAGANTIITSNEPESLDDLLAHVDHGIYIGRMWYVYPINGPQAGDLTGTVTGDSYLIENGKLSKPLRPNVVRIGGNIKDLLMKILGVSDRLLPVNLWGADEAMYASDVLVKEVPLESIGESVDMMPGG